MEVSIESNLMLHGVMWYREKFQELCGVVHKVTTQ